MYTTLIIGLIIFFILLGIILWVARGIRKDAYNQLLKEKTLIPIACAGSIEANKDSVSEAKVDSLQYNIFKDSKGNTLIPDEYKKFIVSGESMQFCGIHDRDLLFVESSSDNLITPQSPQVVVLRRANVQNCQAKYKVRRAWMKCTYSSKNELLDLVRENLIDEPRFGELKELPFYDSDQELLNDLENTRIPNYEKDYISSDKVIAENKQIIISTTYHTDQKKIRFSIHPCSLIEGVVVASFHL